MSHTLLTRRHAFVGGLACLAAGCGWEPPATLSERLSKVLAGGGASQPLAAAGFVVLKGGATHMALAQGQAQVLHPDRPFTPHTKLRAASISKMAVAMLALRLADEGVLDLDADVRPVFDGFLSHPAYPDRAITLRQLLSHTSSVRDPEAYWVPLPGSIRDLLPGLYVTEPDRDTGPGDWFEYANFNYGLAATVIEQAVGERFDNLVSAKVLQPLGLDAGFNWSGVSIEARQAAATLYRRHSGVWLEQMDGPDILASEEPYVLSEPGASLADYQPGDNGTLFSPQGGLRASLADLAVLARAIGDHQEMQSITWRFTPGSPNGTNDDGYFRTFGLGVFIYEPDTSPWPGVRLIGHHGEAYGFRGGAWWAPDRDIAIAYGVNGVPDGQTPPPSWHPSMTQWEQDLLDIAVSSL